MFWFGFANQAPGRQQPHPPSPDGAPLEGEYDEQEGDTISDEINATLLALLPWGISILFHIGLVLLAIFVVWSTTTRLVEEEVIIPIARLSATPGAPMKVKMTKKVTRKRTTKRTVTKPTEQTKALTNKVKTKTALIGAVGGSSAKASPFEAVMRGGPAATFYGSGGNAKRIAYLIDASGSLLDSLPFVVEELKRSINELSDRQTFTVIFFQGEGALEVPPKGMKRADVDMKRQVIEWIDTGSGHIVPTGRSNPVSALKLALSYNPQLVFLLSDNITGQGQYELHQQRLLSEIRKSNTTNAKINTIQFLYPDPLVEVGLKPTLQMVSESTGGIYKFVDGRELGIR